MEDAQRRAVGTLIAELREQRHWSKERFAQEAGISVKTVGRLEKGEVDQPRDGTAEKVAQTLSKTVEDIWGPRAVANDGNGPVERLERIEKKLDEVLKRLPDEAVELERETAEAVRKAHERDASNASAARRTHRRGKAQ
jgi:DNA-binding XRE family transcriptional regulator